MFSCCDGSDGSAGSAKSVDAECLDWGGRPAIKRKLGEHGADGGAELKTMAGEAECVQQTRRRHARTDDRQHIRHSAFDSGPGSATPYQHGERVLLLAVFDSKSAANLF